jgi:hypothetical protein
VGKGQVCDRRGKRFQSAVIDLIFTHKSIQEIDPRRKGAASTQIIVAAASCR